MHLVIGQQTKAKWITVVCGACPLEFTGFEGQALRARAAHYVQEHTSRGFGSRFANSPAGSTASGDLPDADNHDAA